MLNKNNNLYIDKKKVKYKIIEDRGYLLKKNNLNYKEVLIKLKINKKYKTNDYITLSLKDKKIRLIEIFKIIWEGD